MALVLALAAGAARAASFEEGLALKKQEKLAEAEAVFAEIVREQPTDAAALAQWATLLGWLGRFDDSIAAWGRALAEKPDEPEMARDGKAPAAEKAPTEATEASEPKEATERTVVSSNGADPDDDATVEVPDPEPDTTAVVAAADDTDTTAESPPEG